MEPEHRPTFGRRRSPSPPLTAPEVDLTPALSDLPPAKPRGRPLRVLALSGALGAALIVTGVVRLPEGGQYPRFEHDHDALMVSRTAKAERTVTVLFVGNSLTYRNDLAAMLVNLASSDPGDTTRLQVKAETYPNASLEEMRTRTGALAWAQAHRPDYVVLQEHSFWYGAPDGFDAALRATQSWTDAVRPFGETPLLFQVWGNGDGASGYTNIWTPAADARAAFESTQQLGRRLGVQVVPVGQAFEAARQTPGAPDVWGLDRHHPSVAGTYLASLVFYRFLTGRTGAEATYRPAGLSAQDAAALVRLNGG